MKPLPKVIVELPTLNDEAQFAHVYWTNWEDTGELRVCISDESALVELLRKENWQLKERLRKINDLVHDFPRRM